MKRILKAVLALSLSAAAAAAQTPEGAGKPAQDSAQESAAKETPGLAEATRLNAEVVRLYAEGKYAEALPAAARVLELREKEQGPAHPSVGGALVNLAAVEANLGKTSEARGHYRRAATLLEKAGDDAARTLISAVEGLARLEGDIRAAVELHKRALALKEKAYGPESRQAALSHFQLAYFAELRGDNDEAGRRLLRYAEIAEKTKGGSEDDLAVAYTRLACIQRRQGKRDEAAGSDARADEIFTSASEKRQPLDGGVLNGKAVSKAQPFYPAEAKRARAQGTVTVEIIIGETGVVLSACAQKSDRDPSLKRASELAAYRARFTPTYVNGKPVKVRGVITYNFVLQ
ncbi:MAG TPA: TonB family protein [Pyrinomonadaceae bacterium]|jgi:TonB family protein